MKLFIFFLCLLFSIPALSRQYFQCNIIEEGRTDVMVINLQTSLDGTIFLSSGMQNNETERMKAKLEFEKFENGLKFFKIHDKDLYGFVAIPMEFLGKNSNSIDIDVFINGYQAFFSCFTRIYHD